MKKLSILFSMFLVLTLLLAVKPAQADLGDEFWLHFASCANNDPGNVAIGLEQMWIKLTDLGTSVQFTFYNVGSGQSSMTQIYFADGLLFDGDPTITDSGAGVDFEEGGTHGGLPSGNTCDPAFEDDDTTAIFYSAEPSPPVFANGVNNGPPPPDGEWVTITFVLQDLVDFDDVIEQLGTNALRIGIHVQGYADGGSESFATNGYTAVDLMDFSAGARHGNVTVKWTTGTEINNAGFNLYRSSSELGSRTRLNSALIAARGDAVSGGFYSFMDAPGYGTFYYWLEDVEASGSATLHGPVKVSVGPSIRLPVSRPAAP